jgi:hypothetical protein
MNLLPHFLSHTPLRGREFGWKCSYHVIGRRQPLLQGPDLRGVSQLSHLLLQLSQLSRRIRFSQPAVAQKSRHERLPSLQRDVQIAERQLGPLPCQVGYLCHNLINPMVQISNACLCVTDAIHH